MVTTGTAYNPGRFTLWAYNDRDELAASRRYNGTDPGNTSSPVASQQFVFGYDPIGNRTSYAGDGIEGALTYFTNSLNQYTATSQPAESFQYDGNAGPPRNDGNLTQDGRYDYTYDGENRLISVTPRTVVVGSKKVAFAYDYRNRRVRKQVWTWSQSQFGSQPYEWILTEDRRFVYDGWNLLMELNARNSHIPMTKFTWGLDLSGQNGNASVAGLHGAGGIGGLLAMADTKDTQETWDDVQHIYFYDANGNIGQVINVRAGSTYYGQAVARYEYYPFGGVLVARTLAGSSGSKNPFLFSTKYRDSETGLYYYGERYLLPRLGRWLNRDPIGELGGQNLYRALRNDPVSVVDSLGLLPPGGGCLFCGKYTGCDCCNRGDTASRSSSLMQPGDDELMIGTISAEASNCCTGASVTIAAGVYMEKTGRLRLRYSEDALPYLGRDDELARIARKELKDKYFHLQTRFGQEFATAWGPSGRTANAGKTNALLNSGGRILKRVGRGMVVVGVTVDVVAVIKAPSGECGRIVARSVGGVAGGWAGGAGGVWAGAKLGALCGSWGGPVGVAVGGLGGAIGGAILGELVVETIWDNVSTNNTQRGIESGIGGCRCGPGGICGQCRQP